LKKEYRVSGTEGSANEYQKAKRADVSPEHCASGKPLADKSYKWQPVSPTSQRVLSEGRRLLALINETLKCRRDCSPMDECKEFFPHTPQKSSVRCEQGHGKL
jgi:hypothetical protein